VFFVFFEILKRFSLENTLLLVLTCLTDVGFTVFVRRNPQNSLIILPSYVPTTVLHSTCPLFMPIRAT